MAWAWYNTAWLYFVKVTVDHTKVPNTDQLNYPALITEANMPAAFWDHVKADGTDILVTSSDGVTKLKRELVSIDTAGKKMELWVKIPTLSESEDTVLYLYYGNAAASETNNLDTWNDNYKFVSHLEDDPDNQHIKDSTVNANHGTKGAPDQPIEIAGKIGKGQHLAVGENVAIPYSDTLDCADQISLECWIYAEGTSGAVEAALSKGGCYFLGYLDNFKLRGQVTIATIVNWIYGNTALTRFQWFYALFTYDGAFLKIYLNGASDQAPIALVGAVDIVATNLNIGQNGYDGYADEQRVSNIARSADYGATCFNNQDDPASFYSVGAEFSYLFPFIITPLTSDEVKADVTSDEVNAEVTADEVEADLTSDEVRADLTSDEVKVRLK